MRKRGGRTTLRQAQGKPHSKWSAWAQGARFGGGGGFEGEDGLVCGAVSGDMKNLCVVLVGTRNPLNVGAVARAMSNFGAMELRAVRPYEKAWREARSAGGGGGRLGGG